jgi:hypothetical protein
VLGWCPKRFVDLLDVVYGVCVCFVGFDDAVCVWLLGFNFYYFLLGFSKRIVYGGLIDIVCVYLIFCCLFFWFMLSMVWKMGWFGGSSRLSYKKWTQT